MDETFATLHLGEYVLPKDAVAAFSWSTGLGGDFGD
jgi:hypothetical protein